MISIVSLLYDLDFRLNKLASHRHQSIPDEEKIISLNNAQISLIKKKYGLNNIYQSGFESNNKRKDELQGLIVSDKEIVLEKSGDSKFSASLTAVTDYFFYVKSWITANKNACTNHVIDVIRIPHPDVSQWLSNVHLCPSFEYQETFCTISADTIEVYTDGTFEPRSVFLSYLRYPEKVDIEGYIHFDGTPSTNHDCELPLFLKDELLDIAVLEIAMATENINAVELTNQRTTKNE